MSSFYFLQSIGLLKELDSESIKASVSLKNWPTLKKENVFPLEKIIQKKNNTEKIIYILYDINYIYVFSIFYLFVCLSVAKCSRRLEEGIRSSITKGIGSFW